MAEGLGLRSVDQRAGEASISANTKRNYFTFTPQQERGKQTSRTNIIVFSVISIAVGVSSVFLTIKKAAEVLASPLLLDTLEMAFRIQQRGRPLPRRTSVGESLGTESTTVLTRRRNLGNLGDQCSEFS